MNLFTKQKVTPFSIKLENGGKVLDIVEIFYDQFTKPEQVTPFSIKLQNGGKCVGNGSF